MIFRRVILLLILLVILRELFAEELRNGQPLNPPRRIYADDSQHFTSEGNLGMTVTNFGVFGRRFDESYSLLNQPSCLYRLHSNLPKEQVEHFSYGGLWVGGIREGIVHVSTGITDGSFSAGEPGLEFTNTASEADSVHTRSSILTSPLFDPAAISHQDLICDYTDTNTVLPGTTTPIPEHDPLGIAVHQEVYCWNYSYADAFAILSFTIRNLWDTPIEGLYVALWLDASVGNMNYTNYDPGGGPGGRWNWYDNLNNFVQTEDQKIAISFDEDGDDGWAESYLGVTVLGGEAKDDSFNVYYHQWPWSTSSSMEYPLWVMPVNDEERYEKMATPGDYTQIPGYDMFGNPVQNPEEVTESWMLFLSCGPFETLAPGDSAVAVFAIVCGRWAGNYSDDVPERRANLMLNAQWAQTIYNGEDANGNGILDPGEDLNGNGQLDHYIFPKPPPSPRLAVIPGDGQVTLYWDNSPEATVDSLTGLKDFEGYRIYSSPKTLDLGEEYTLLAQFDIDYDLDPTDEDSTLIGFNTGFSAIALEDSILIEGHYYHYSFTDTGVLNGWPQSLYYTVTAYDRGNPQNNLPSLESSPLENRVYAYPGTTPAQSGDFRVGVYPNPYRVSASWDGPGPMERLIWFQYLPPRAEIRIFTLSGDLVDVIEHNASTYNGADVSRLSGGTYGAGAVFSGGEHAWDLLNQNNQEIATGLYLYTVENLDSGQIKTGTFMVIK